MQTIIFTALITTGLCFAGFVTYGQTFSEWWQQKKTRIKYLRKQAAVLEMLKETIENGYENAEEGIDSVGAIAEEELALHEQFIKSLPFVKPTLKNSPDFLSSYALATALIKKFGETAKTFLQDPGLVHDDFQWIIPYVIATLRDLRDGLEELDLLTSDGIYRMKDDERYKKIRATASSIRATYETGMSFLTQLDAILVAMQEDANDEFIKKQL